MKVRPSLLVQFTLLGLFTTALIAAGFGWFLSKKMIADALDQATQDAAETVTKFVTPRAGRDDFGPPTPARIAAWKWRLGGVVGAMDIARVKVWNTQGQVVYSDDASLIGRSFPVRDNDELREALEGRIARELSAIGKSENVGERQYGRLMEVYVPVVLPGSTQVVGVYEVYQRFAPLQATINAIRRLVWGGSAAAFGLLYAALFVLVSGASRQLVRQEERLRASFLGTVRALASAVDFKDSSTGAHSSHVAEYAVATARRLGFREDALEDIRMAAYLHDLGKIGIADTMLKKPAALTREEWTEMRRHSTIAAKILDPVPLAPSIKLAIKHNHERWDGTGYPDGLRGEEIPLEARILSVTDAYEAMTSDRPYRQALPRAAALEELRRNTGSQFDPRVVEAFLAAVCPDEENEEAVHRRPEPVGALKQSARS